MHGDLTRLEADLRKVPGVRHARVVGTDFPEEIHIVSSGERSPKQMVRDVQSLASAGFGFAIDHRIVSIVQLEQEPREIRLDDPSVTSPEPVRSPSAQTSSTRAGTGSGAAPNASASSERGRRTFGHEAAVGSLTAPPPPPPMFSREGLLRPALEHVVLASKRDKGWVKVGLRWPDGNLTEGAGAAGQTRGARARGATSALHRALEPVLDTMEARIDIDEVIIHRVGASDSVSVRAVFYENGSSTPLVGSAIIQDDVATAAARAFLHAVNRKIK